MTDSGNQARSPYSPPSFSSKCKAAKIALGFGVGCLVRARILRLGSTTVSPDDVNSELVKRSIVYGQSLCGRCHPTVAVRNETSRLEANNKHTQPPASRQQQLLNDAAAKVLCGQCGLLESSSAVNSSSSNFMELACIAVMLDQSAFELKLAFAHLQALLLPQLTFPHQLC